MRPSQILRSGGDGWNGWFERWGNGVAMNFGMALELWGKIERRHMLMLNACRYLGGWGNFGSQPQKGVISFGLSANRQRPLAGTLNAAIFNVWRRFSHQILYIAPPMIIGYLAMDWAIERNEYLNSKPGRLEYGEEE
ncbi:Cytochrome b-c1 complex subunit [Lachnellula hyalina]|uniref:Cytochrome b-c1 complex subunit 8 n=1 Tax=Lachnellula hyalina TaxID=1316788 RepID=A0A8H8RAT8_9HELO|nr:Cytochrome b-c1 complex subunit [Lachnellula hyalina]TVY31144.1 Cytochrome b-c1 complex subunit [Lachnellula hyalina]